MSNARAKARPDLPAGLQVFGEYVIDQPIDEGPIWTVYRALHVSRQGERFSLWSMKANLSGNPNLVEGFARQARLLERLAHKGITPVIATGVDQGVIFMITPETRGQSLRAALAAAGGKLPAPDVARIVREAAEVLDYLHNHRPQIVHRALDPSKILLAEPDQRVMLLEVGYAHALLEAKVEPVEELPRAIDGYRAPEDAPGLPVGAPVDQYSLACIAFEALTGQPVSATGTLPKDLIHPSVEAVLTRARSATVLGRYASVGAFADALARAISVTSKSTATAPRAPTPPPLASAAAKPTAGGSSATTTPSPSPPTGPGLAPSVGTTPGLGPRRTATLVGTGITAASAPPAAATVPATATAASTATTTTAAARAPEAPAQPAVGKPGFHQRRGTMVGMGPPAGVAPSPAAAPKSGALDGDIQIFGEDIPLPAGFKPANVLPQSGSTARFASLSHQGEAPARPATPAVAPAGLIAPAAPAAAPSTALIAPARPATDETLEADDVDILVDDTSAIEGAFAPEESAPEESLPADSDAGAPPPLPYNAGTPPGVPSPIAPLPSSVDESPPSPSAAAVPAPVPAPTAAAAPRPSGPDTEPSPPPWPMGATPTPVAPAPPSRSARKRSVALPALATVIVLGVLGAGGAYYAGLLALPPAVTALLPPRPSTSSVTASPEAPTTAHRLAHAHPTPAPPGATHTPPNVPPANRAAHDEHPLAPVAATAVDASAPVATARPDAGRTVVPTPPPAVVAAAPPVPPAPSPAPEALPPAPRPRNARLPATPSAEDRNHVVAEVQRQVDACNGHMGRHARMVVRYDSSGHVSQIIWAGNLFTNRPIGACIEAALRAVPVPPFSRPVWETDYRFYVR